MHWYMCVFIDVEVLFFFKQETAYEVRISDWSSDVCSSDLLRTLLDSGVEFAFVQLPQIEGAMGQFILTILAAINELEAGIISERTKAALGSVQAAIERDGFYVTQDGRKITKLGNPRGGEILNRSGNGNGLGVKAIKAKADRDALAKAHIIAEYRSRGIVSLEDTVKALNEDEVPT